jgi:hypothetical protein
MAWSQWHEHSCIHHSDTHVTSWFLHLNVYLQHCLNQWLRRRFPQAIFRLNLLLLFLFCFLNFRYCINSWGLHSQVANGRALGGSNSDLMKVTVWRVLICRYRENEEHYWTQTETEQGPLIILIRKFAVTILIRLVFTSVASAENLADMNPHPVRWLERQKTA